jgi:hypothetical protein
MLCWKLFNSYIKLQRKDKFMRLTFVILDHKPKLFAVILLRLSIVLWRCKDSGDKAPRILHRSLSWHESARSYFIADWVVHRSVLSVVSKRKAPVCDGLGLESLKYNIFQALYTFHSYQHTPFLSSTQRVAPNMAAILAKLITGNIGERILFGHQ